ncbi:MAG: hypothetical protein INR66_20995 [Gordonia polyisoprenivorans]|nr:hypothetical protein [Gordonia polyisoprenivorans]
MTIPSTTDRRPPTSLDELRRSVILGRAINTAPASVDGLLRLADLALSNVEVSL